MWLKSDKMKGTNKQRERSSYTLLIKMKYNQKHYGLSSTKESGRNKH